MSELKATTNAGTIDDPIPQELIWKDAQGKFYKVAGAGGSSSGADPRVGDLADLNTTDKTTVVAAINEVNLKQATGGAPDANDINKGVTKLSDAIDSDLNATDGVTAATPLAVKNVNSKIGDLANLNTTDKSNIVNALNEVKANSSGSGSGNSYVVTPTIIAPSNGALGQSTKVNIIGTTYKNVFPDDARKHRVFEVCTDNNFTSNVIRKEVDADSWTVEQVLSAETKHYARIKDISTDGYESAFSPVINFTTGAKVGAISPTITLLGYNDSPSDIGSGLKIKGSEYQSNGDAVDTHKATSWSIRSAVSRSNVWESLNDTVNKTQITVPRGTLQKGTSYIVSVIYHSTNYADSAPSEVKFTTSNDFGTVQAPVVSIDGGATDTSLAPVINGGVFSNTREPDTHVDTELVIIRSADMQQMVSISTSNDSVTIQLELGILEKSTQYKARMRYKGQNFGWSEWGELTFTTTANTDGLQNPTVSIEGSTSNGYTYDGYFAASDFNFIGDEDEIDKCDWHLYLDKPSSDEEVWKDTDSKITKFLTCFDKYALKPSTKYKLKYRQHAKNADVWSEYYTVSFTTAADVKYPTIKFKMKNKINLSKICGWFNSSDFEVKLNGVKNDDITSNYNNDFILSDEGTVVEIINIKDPTNYPALTFAGNDGSLNANLISIEAPLPPLRSSNNGSLVTSLGGKGGNGGNGGRGGDGGVGVAGGGSGSSGYGTAGKVGTNGGNGSAGYGVFSYCTSLTTLPENLFKYNARVVSLGGQGGKGGDGGTGGRGGNGGSSVGAIRGGNGGNGGKGGDGGDGGAGYGVFSYCTSLTTLPENLFKYNAQLANLGGKALTHGAGGYGGNGGTGGDGSNSNGNHEVGGGTGGIGGGGGLGGLSGSSYGAFSHCTSLTTLPENLFKYNTQLANLGGSSEYGGDGGTGGRGGDGNIHWNGVNGSNGGQGGNGNNGGRGGTGASSVIAYGAFSYCTSLTTLPENLFKYNAQLISLGGHGGHGGNGGRGGRGGDAYYKNGNLGGNGGRGGNGGTGASSVIAYGAFSYCTSLTTLPENLFKYNAQLISLGSVGVTGTKGFDGSKGNDASGSVGGAGGTGGRGGYSALNNPTTLGAFSQSTKAIIKLRFTATNITKVKYFAYGTATKGTVYVPVGSTTANTFTNDPTANVNIVVE